MAFGGKENVFWTLAVEEQFYLLWPLVLILTPRRRLVVVALVMIALATTSKVSALALGSWLDFRLLPWQMDLLGAGCLLAVLVSGMANETSSSGSRSAAGPSSQLQRGARSRSRPSIGT